MLAKNHGVLLMDKALDKNGKTEEQFLREYDVTKYFRPSVTVDSLIYSPAPRGGKLLLIKRGGHPYIGHWAFPGGFVDANEPCAAAAKRELMEETGLTDIPCRQLVTVSTPGRDPRWRNITVVYCARVNGELDAVGGDDASDAKWFDFEVEYEGSAATITFDNGKEKFTSRLEVVRDAFGQIDIDATRIVERGKLGFDHAKIVLYLYEAMRNDANGGAK